MERLGLGGPRAPTSRRCTERPRHAADPLAQRWCELMHILAGSVALPRLHDAHRADLSPATSRSHVKSIKGVVFNGCQLPRCPCTQI